MEPVDCKILPIIGEMTMKRRQFLTRALAAGAGLWAARHLPAVEPPTTTKTGDSKMSFQQPPLPFAMAAMKPFLSEEQLTYHNGKHHATGRPGAGAASGSQM